MSAVNFKLLEEVKNRLIREVEQATQQLVEGQGISQFEDYRYIIGGIKGLRDAIATIEAVVEELKEGNS